MPRKKAGMSSRAFSIRYLRRSREIYRRFLATKPWIKQMHSTLLGLKSGMKVVDVGCGTGDFTRYLASLIPGRSTIIGVDFRAANISAAEKQTRKEGIADRISFREGDAYNIPVEDGWADLVCCRTLLMHLTEPLKAVREMSRVARKGGTVAAFENAGGFDFVYTPVDERFTKLALRIGESLVDGVRKLEGKHFDIGYRLPTIFHKAGLREIIAEVQADTYLASDPRRRLEDVRDELTFHLASFKETKKLHEKAMIAGGAPKQKIDQYNRWMEKWMKSLLDDDEKLRNDTVVSTGGMFIVAGRKQQ